MTRVTVAEHLIATTRRGARLRTHHAQWLWHRLRVMLPAVLSCVLMPDHIHLMSLPGCVMRFRRVLNSFTARFKIQFDVLEPELANSVAIAQRMMRYGYFNPVHAGLVDDPWRWPWSTLRDLVGAAYPSGHLLVGSHTCSRNPNQPCSAS